jgi:metal-sulfur cluster biosynthetic enzyme
MFYTIAMSFSESTDPVVGAVRSALSTVEDPELGVDIVSLGLVYAIEHEQGHVRVVHTLTSMGCPLGPVIERDIDEALARVDGVATVDVQLVFEPPWSPEQMSDDARFLLGVYS